tara:strand:- start:1019 stop:1282 length:264 start_codon:yes stop_codon:yes gene_type:complete
MRDAPEEVTNEVKRESNDNTLPRMGKETSIQKTDKNILSTQQCWSCEMGKPTINSNRITSRAITSQSWNESVSTLTLVLSHYNGAVR